MSKYVTEIIKDIRTNPEGWVRNGSSGLKKDKITIYQFGNGHILFCFWFTSVVVIDISGIEIDLTHLTWWDKIRLEQTFKWWIKNATVQMLERC